MSAAVSYSRHGSGGKAAVDDDASCCDEDDDSDRDADDGQGVNDDGRTMTPPVEYWWVK